jgi:hypothetical protein
MGLSVDLLHSVRIKRILCGRLYSCSISVHRELREVLIGGSISCHLRDDPRPLTPVSIQDEISLKNRLRELSGHQGPRSEN